MSYNFSIIKNIYIYNIPLFEIHSCIPNLFPNDIKILFILKQYLNLKKNQKLYNDYLYSYKKNKNFNNTNDSNDKNLLNSISKKNINKQNLQKKEKEIYNNISKMLINDNSISEEINNNYYYQNDYLTNPHRYNYSRRVKKDVDIFEIEKIIKNIKGENKKKKNEDVKNNKKCKKDSHSSILYKKLLSNKKIISLIKTNNNNKSNYSQTKEKLNISDNSTYLSNKIIFGNSDSKIKKKIDILNITSKSHPKNILPYSEKLINKKYILKDKGNSNKAHKKSSFFLPSKKLMKRWISQKHNESQKDILLSSNITNKIININDNSFNKTKDKCFKESKSNNFKGENKYIFKETLNFSPSKNIHKIVKFKLKNLKEVMKMRKSMNNSYIASYNKLKSFNKGFEYSPENYLFKNIIENEWEEGEDKNAQNKCDYLSKNIMYNIQKKYNQYKKGLIKSTTLKQILKCGNIYEDEFYFY